AAHFAGLRLERGLRVLALGNFFQNVRRVAALRLGCTDLLVELIAFGLELLGFGLCRAPVLVERQHLCRRRAEAAALEAAVERVGIVTDPFKVVHRGPAERGAAL